MPVNKGKNVALQRLRVQPIARADAKRMIHAKHYMRTFPQGSKVHFGIFDGRKAVGVCVFGYSSATTAKVERLVGQLERREYIELQRLWISDAYGHNTESFVMSRMMRQLRAAGVRVAVTHAGGCKNDCGIVYQASGWLYYGSEPCRDFYRTDAGEYKNILAAMRFGRVNSKGKTPQQVGMELFGPGCIVDALRHLYAYPVDRRMRRRMQAQSKPYPKSAARFRFAQEWQDATVEDADGQG